LGSEFYGLNTANLKEKIALGQKSHLYYSKTRPLGKATQQKMYAFLRNVESKRAEVPLHWLPLDKYSNTDAKPRVLRYFKIGSFFPPASVLLGAHSSNGQELPNTFKKSIWDSYYRGTEFQYHVVIITHLRVQIRPVMSCLYFKDEQNAEHFYWQHLRQQGSCLRGITPRHSRKDSLRALAFQIQNMQSNSAALENLPLLFL